MMPRCRCADDPLGASDKALGSAVAGEHTRGCNDPQDDSVSS